jgi:hypothetical protein
MPAGSDLVEFLPQLALLETDCAVRRGVAHFELAQAGPKKMSLIGCHAVEPGRVAESKLIGEHGGLWQLRELSGLSVEVNIWTLLHH